jgi:uncharacterized SAM-binding protein YcdF (DUF218 family)
MRKWRRTVFWIVAAGVIAILVLALNSRALLSAAGRWLDVGGKPQRADAVVLLNGGYNTRPFVAAALVRGGWAPKVLLSTCALHALEADGSIPPSHEVALRVLEYGGARRNEVTMLDVSANSTYDEAIGVAKYLAAHPAKRLLLVTERPHTRRAQWIFERVLAAQHTEIAVVSAPTDGFDYAVWWRSEDGFLFVVSEYLKLFFYALRYGWLGYEIAASIVAALVLRAWFWRRRKPVSPGSVIY